MTPPSKPVKERLALGIVAALTGITAGADYPVTIANVIRPKRSFPTDDELGDRWVTVEQQEMASTPASYGNDNDRVQSFWITGWLAVSDHTDTPVDSLLNDLEASIERALKTLPRVKGRVLDGLADDVRVVSTAPEPRAAFEGIRLEVEVSYNVDDPFVADA